MSPEPRSRSAVAPPAAERYRPPDCFENPERPGALQKRIDRRRKAGPAHPEGEPRVAALQRIADEHDGKRHHAEKRERIESHGVSFVFRNRLPSWPDRIEMMSL